MKQTKSDPTGQRANRARTSKRLWARLQKAQIDVISLFRAIPKKRRTYTVNEQKPVYDYDLTPEQIEILNNKIRQVLNDVLLETQGDTMPMGWWYKGEVELPVRQATLEELNEFNRLIALAILAGMMGRGGMEPQRIAPEVVLSSPKYLAELRNVYIENFQVIKSLSNTTAAQVIQKINNGIRAGLTPTEISKSIQERFDVSKSNADRIARTEVNRAYTDSKIRATKTAGEISGFKPMVRHISALLPDRTRKHHAARHYLVYTPEEQNAWWAKDANRINCLCSIRTVLIDKDGNYIEA